MKRLLKYTLLLSGMLSLTSTSQAAIVFTFTQDVDGVGVTIASKAGTDNNNGWSKGINPNGGLESHRQDSVFSPTSFGRLNDRNIRTHSVGAVAYNSGLTGGHDFVYTGSAHSFAWNSSGVMYIGQTHGMSQAATQNLGMVWRSETQTLATLFNNNKTVYSAAYDVFSLAGVAGHTGQDTVKFAFAPEPSSTMMLGLSVMALGLRRQRKN